jgi:alkanesulfonate monooxygenase SsuD/methylene tetrahydromethanopterin reductase-like flavin-dependent oxidoreductase (luciferase family)
MRFGIFYELQLPRPWGPDGERRIVAEALEQIELADRLGVDYAWEVEHHFLEDYSHSSAAEFVLAAASQRTERIRLGHGIVQVPPGFNHPARVAERAAMLDLVSNGRVELGTGEASSQAELGGFLVDRQTKRAQWEDAVAAIASMLVEEPFAGWDSPWLRMPPRNVVPKPLQRPHPPLWVACSRRETIHLAARRGLGALSFSFVDPAEAAPWVREYYELIASEECVPLGFAVNPNVAVVLPAMLHGDEATAIERGIDGAHFFGYSLAHYYAMRDHVPGTTNVWEEFLARREQVGFARDVIQADQAALGVKVMQDGLGSLRGAIGTPEQVRELVRRYEEAGVDQVIFALQAGPNRHEHVCESIELIAREVMPEFAERRDERERMKGERLGPAVRAALERRERPRQPPLGYFVDERAELARGRRGPGRRAPAEVAERLRTGARRAARDASQRALERVVRDASPEQLERRFASPLVQRALFEGMARSFDPRFAAGFEGVVEYELTYPAAGRPADTWRIVVEGGRARAVQGADGGGGEPAVRLRVPASDFARIAADLTSPATVVLQGRLAIEGDFGVAARLSEMFGGPSPY